MVYDAVLKKVSALCTFMQVFSWSFSTTWYALDYAYMNGVGGEKVDHLTAAERWQRYPALPGNPDGAGKYLLQVGNGGLYLDALKQEWESMRGNKGSSGLVQRCGLGGKVNTKPGYQNARFKGSKIRASRTIRNGEEIFVPYRKSYKFQKDSVGGESFGWQMFGGSFYRDMG